MMKPRLPIFIRFWPLWEIIVFILVGYWIGYGWAFLLIVITSLMGVLLIRQQGVMMMRAMRDNPLIGASMFMMNMQRSLILLSGILFMIPGFITDALAILCLLPGCKRFLLNYFLRANLRSMQRSAANTSPPPSRATRRSTSQIIEGESWKDENKKDGEK